MLITDGRGRLPALADIDLADPALYHGGDPHAAWRVLRAEAPVWRQVTPDGTPFWSVTRYSDVVGVLRDSRTFSSEYSTMLTVLGEGDPARGKAIHLMDPPRNAAVRSASVGALSMRVVRRHEPEIRQRLRRLVERALRDAPCDFAALAGAVPMLVAGPILGVPSEAWDEVGRWTLASMAPADPAYAAGDPSATLMQAHVYLFAMFADLVRQRRDQPGDDLVSLLTRLRFDGRSATDEEVLVNCYAFVMGAGPTVPQAASHLMLVAARDAALWSRIRERPQVVPWLVDEALRWSSPINHLLRRTTADVRLGDQGVPRGGLVAAWVASANRDEDVFAAPDVFDPLRRPNPQIAFGVGPHRCVGNAVAQFGLRLLIEELAGQIASVRLVGEVRHLESNFLNGITRLPLDLRPASGD
jgi:cytochrome P450